MKKRKITYTWYWKCLKCGYGPNSSEVGTCGRPEWVGMNFPKCTGMRPVLDHLPNYELEACNLSDKFSSK